MIIYIHGFGSSGFSRKPELYRAFCKAKCIPFICPSLPTIPNLAMQTLEELIQSYENVSLIGSSLGGFYALYLAQKYQLKAVVINPAMHPYERLKEALNQSINYHDRSTFEWNDTHLAMLKNLKAPSVNKKDIMLLLQKGDDVLDYREAVHELPHANTTIEEGGTHGFEGIERYFDTTMDFLDVKLYK